MTRSLLHGRSTRTRALAAGFAALVAVGGIFAASAAVSATQSAWNDRVVVSATVSAGTWKTPPVVVPPTPLPSSCVAMTPQGTPLAGGQCSITGITVNPWDNGVFKIRDYQVAIKTNAGAGYVVFDVDLSKVATPGAWSWAKAGTIATGHFTPSADYTCSELPRLRATGPSNWGSSYQVMVRVIEDRTMSGPGAVNCS